MNKAQATLLTLAAAFGLAVAAPAEDAKLPPISTRENITYATDIKPIFDASCVKCHSGDRAKARLHMDTLAGVLQGTRHGKIVVAGDPEKSQLVQVIAHVTDDEDSWMPPVHNKLGIKTLTPEQIGLIMGWIKQGAK
jgi:hypothetical protein